MKKIVSCVMGFIAAGVAGLSLLMGMAPIAQAATLTNTVGTAYTLGPGAGRHYVVGNTLDFSTVGVSSNDTVDLILIPSNTLVESVFYQVTTAATNSAAPFDVGDSSSYQRFVNNAAATGTTAKTQGTTSYAVIVSGGGTSTVALANSYLYTADTPLRLRARAPMNTGVIRVQAQLIDLSKPSP